MKNILLFCFLYLLIPFLIISILVVNPKQQDFKFSKNTMVRVYRSKTKKIENVPLEEYIIGVVSSEMPVSFELEALKAQAVAARSYVMYKILKKTNSKYDVVDTVLNQVYTDDNSLKKKWGSSYQQNKAKVTKAVTETAYQYVTYKGQIANALFFSTSSGYTENSEDVFTSKVHYLQSVESKWDNISPVFKEQEEFTYKEFCTKLKIKNNNKFTIKVLDKTDSGRINQIKINEKTFTGKQVVELLGLRSVKFEINVNDKIIITTKGYGHGVGMSQYGAEGMARVGYKYDEILKHYYTDIKIEKIK